MENGYNKRKLLEAFGVWENEIRGLEEETRKTLQEKQRRDGKRKELQEAGSGLNEVEGLIKPAEDIDRLLSYAGENTQFGRRQEERAARLKERCDRLARAVESYRDREQTYTEAAKTDKCLRLYRRLCRQLETTDDAAGSIQEELNQRADKYLPRKDALGIGIRLLGLSGGLRGAENLKRNVNPPTYIYIKETAEMLAAYIENYKLEPQGETRLNNVLATLYMWLIVLADKNKAQTWFSQLDSLHIRWEQEECPGTCFERFYELERQNKATLAAFRLLGYREFLDGDSQTDILWTHYTALDVVKEYLEAIESGSAQDSWRDSAQEMLGGYIQAYIRSLDMNTPVGIDRAYRQLKEVVDKLGKFRGQPCFKGMDEIVSAAVNAYYDKAGERYDSSKEIEGCKDRWEVLEPNLDNHQSKEDKDVQEQKRKGIKAATTLEKRQEEKAGAGEEGMLSLRWMLVAVLVPLNVISMVLFELVLGYRALVAPNEREDDEKRQRIGKENRRLNLIAAASMVLFYFTGGYGAGEYADTIEWLFTRLSFDSLFPIWGVIIVFVIGAVLVPFFAWTAFKGMFELLVDIRERNVKQ